MSDGIITRFTGLSKADWNEFMEKAEIEYKAKISEPTPIKTEAESKIA